MKFLLAAFNAKYIHSNPGLYSMRASVPEKLREHVEIAEYTINHRLEDVLADLYERKPDAVGFSCYIWNWTMIQDVIVEFHKLLPQVPIWLGGPEVSFDAQDILEEYPQITGVMIGEGEITFAEVLTCYVNKSLPMDIPGTIYRDTEGVICMAKQRELSDLSKLPFLYEEMDDFANRIIYYESSRGCPYRCSYCLSSIEKKVRLRRLDIVFRELQFFLDYRLSQVKFVDRTFNCNAEHALRIWDYLEKNDNGITNFHFEIAAESLTEDQIVVLNRLRPGLVQLEIGVQTTNPKTLEAIRRPMRFERLKEIVRRLHDGHNIHIHLDLIAGLPYENYESFMRSFNHVYRMEPEQLQLGFLKVLKGSYMHECAEEYGIEYMRKPPYEVLFTSWISYEEIRKLKRVEEMVEIYYNSNQFVATLKLLESCFETPFAMYEALADFYKEKGYFLQTPARSYRYDVLFDFVCDRALQYKDIFSETLRYDLYLRENVKRRPDFAPEESLSIEQKERVRAFFQQEEKDPIYLSDYQGYDAKQMAKMTHVESFRYRVDTIERGMHPGRLQRAENDNLLLFDYQKRNPLTRDARVLMLEC